MKLLILGGTQFVGRAIAEAALANGHSLTLFHRGKTNPDLFPQAEHILADRDDNIAALGDRTWDAVIDVSGYIPRHVKDAAQYLADRVQRYVFISTISVYEDSEEIGRDEDAALIELQDKTTEEVTGETYGGLKVLCEREAENAMPGRVLTIRPGLIVGPHDHTNRFTYWPVRIREGGRMLAPGDGNTPTQFIDVRDLAAWIMRMVEQKATGIYNATGPDYRLTFAKLFETCREVSGADVELVWVDDASLLENGVQPFADLPFWIPQP
ncbi:MAG: SDR family oxidoreductase, partial [Anaerolineae bacterium]|nr:SDR family oxidoreductase [Anaerolineae bacterium]